MTGSFVCFSSLLLAFHLSDLSGGDLGNPEQRGLDPGAPGVGWAQNFHVSLFLRILNTVMMT